VTSVIDRQWIGHALTPTEFAIERGRLRFFAKVIGETDPIYTDLQAARDAGYADLPAPPTFLFSAEFDSGATFAMLESLGVNIDNILHGEQSFTYYRDVVAGDTVTVRSVIADIYERRDGALQFIVKQSDVVNQRVEKVAELRSVIVVRS
jgi:acyl dehydratase